MLTEFETERIDKTIDILNEVIESSGSYIAWKIVDLKENPDYLASELNLEELINKHLKSEISEFNNLCELKTYLLCNF